MILHNRISETSYNVALTIETEAYVVTYGKQRETYSKTVEGLMKACEEYAQCVYHAETCEGLYDIDDE